MKEKKIRIRSKYELSIRKKEFLKSCKILDKLKIKYFLMSGILLGAVRDKKLISWDWDIEICVFNDELEKKLKLISSELKKEFLNWKGNNFQLDDVLVFGFTI